MDRWLDLILGHFFQVLSHDIVNLLCQTNTSRSHSCFFFFRNPDHYEVPALLDPKRNSKKIEKNGTTTEKETHNTPPKTMWITLEQNPANQNGTDSAIKDGPSEKIARKDNVCVAKEAESVEIISLIKLNDVETETEPVEVKIRRLEPCLLTEKKSLIDEPTLEPIEIVKHESKSGASKKHQNSKNVKSFSSDPVENEITTAATKTSRVPEEDVQQLVDSEDMPPPLTQFGEKLIPIKVAIPNMVSRPKLEIEPTTTPTTKPSRTKISTSSTIRATDTAETTIKAETPKVIPWSNLGIEPMAMQLNQDGLNFPAVRIGPLTEANRWSEKTVSKNEPKAIKQADPDDGKVAEGKEKVRKTNSFHVKTQAVY